MNGTPNGYTHQISSPGWGFGGDELEVMNNSKHPYSPTPTVLVALVILIPMVGSAGGATVHCTTI
jgi:hypothetical protein